MIIKITEIKRLGLTQPFMFLETSREYQRCKVQTALFIFSILNIIFILNSKRQKDWLLPVFLMSILY